MIKIVLVAIVCAGCTMMPAQQQYPFQNPAASVEDRVTDLISRMTLGEKIDALGTNPTVPRLGVVGTGHVEGLHGLALGH
jgi:beta-glucosidase